MDTIHSMAVTCVDTGQKKSFVRDDLLPLSGNDRRALRKLGHDMIRPLTEGLKLLEEAEMLLGHNIIDFDIPAIQLVYPEFDPMARIIDTLVMSRMVFANVKEADFRQTAKGQLEGRYIGQHGLEAWGQRLGLSKGDYKKAREEELKVAHREQGMEPPTKEELHHYVWGMWNVDMHDYMIVDTDVNTLLWHKIEIENWSPEATKLEHHIHALMVQQERNGFLFNRHKAEKLADDLRGAYDEMSAEAIVDVGKWYKPEKLIENRADPDKGEHLNRRKWGAITHPKRTMNYSKANAKFLECGDWTKLRASTVENAPMVKVKLMEFNPNSRPQITDRLKTLYEWEPQDFTEKGSAKVDDEILRALADDIPLAETLAELFYVSKRLGQVADGKNGWLKLMRADGRIHGRVNVGGTVSGRATHAAPNVSQVPGVNPVEFGTKDGQDPKVAHEKGLIFLDERAKAVNSWGAPIILDSKWNDKKGEWSIYTRGRTGGYGWDCRELFEVPDGYKLMGCDLSGVEFRCLANLCFPFDDGELVDIVLNGDIHQKNADLTGISRSVAKRLLYACMYGGGDAKLGSIVEPFASEQRQKTIGKSLRAKLMAAMPSLKAAIKEIHREMRRNGNRIRGLDGRWLYARSKHSALNLRLQSDGALIAKKWCLLTDDAYFDEGWDHDINLEYAFASWSHDEIQVAVKEQLAQRAANIAEAMAPVAGDYFQFNCPITAEAKVGDCWAETH